MAGSVIWFGIKQWYEWRLRTPSRLTTLEERVVIAAGRTWRSACRAMLIEQRRYCRPDPGANFLVIPILTCTGYEMDPCGLDQSEVIEV